eukprot:6802466-Prymnesium_polylepis.1
MCAACGCGWVPWPRRAVLYEPTSSSRSDGKTNVRGRVGEWEKRRTHAACDKFKHDPSVLVAMVRYQHACVTPRGLHLTTGHAGRRGVPSEQAG